MSKIWEFLITVAVGLAVAVTVRSVVHELIGALSSIESLLIGLASALAATSAVSWYLKSRRRDNP